MRRTVTIFLLTQKTTLDGPFRYLEHVRKVYEKISRGPWKNYHLIKIRFCQNILTLFWTTFLPHFFVMKLFSKESRKLFVDFTDLFKVFGGCTQSWSLCEYKHRDHKIHQSDYMLREMKKLWILKNETQNGDGVFWKTSLFEMKLFFNCLWFFFFSYLVQRTNKKIRTISFCNINKI